MPINDLLPFATAGGANVLPQANWSGLPSRLQGFAAGVAESAHFNKAFRQSAFTSAMIGQFSMHGSNEDILDDGNVDDYERKFTRALRAIAGLRRAPTGGTADHVTITFDPPFSTYTGITFMADITLSINAGADISVNGMLAKLLLRVDGRPIQLDDAPAGTSLIMFYDGAAVRVLDIVTYTVQNGLMNYSDDTGTADALVATLEPPLRRYVKGQRIWVKKGAQGNGTTTPVINVNGLGNKQIVKRNGAVVAIGDLPANAWLPLGFDGTYWRVVGFVNSDFLASSVPFFIANMYGSMALAGGSVNNVLNFGNTFTEKVGLTGTVLSAGVVFFGNDAGVYLVTGGVITTAGVFSSELLLMVNGAYYAVQTTDPSGYGLNSSVARIVRIPSGANMYLSAQVTQPNQVALGYYGSGDFSTYLAAYKIGT
jgi:hypothetical protein